MSEAAVPPDRPAAVQWVELRRTRPPVPEPFEAYCVRCSGSRRFVSSGDVVHSMGVFLAAHATCAA